MIGISPGDTQLLHKEVYKKPSNPILLKLVDGANKNVKKDEPQSPLSY